MEHRATQQFVREALENETRQEQAFVELGKEFDKIDFGKVLTIEGMVDQTEVANGIATLKRYRQLLAIRSARFKVNTAESEEFIRTRAPEGIARDTAISAMTKKAAQTSKAYADLDRAQSAHADSIGNFLEWCAAQKGKLSNRNGQLMFTSEPQRAEMMRLAASLQATEDEATKAMNEFTVFVEQQQKHRSEAQEFVKK